MSKVAQQFLDIDPWQVVETGFHPDRHQVAESIFATGNEFMGVRAYFEEGYSGEHLLGSYFNGIYEYEDVQPKPWPKGPIHTTHYMVNGIDWLFTRIACGDEDLDLARVRFSGFRRSLDLREGVYRREFTWAVKGGAKIRMLFERFTSMADPHLAYQRLTATADRDTDLTVEMGLDLGEPGSRRFWTEVKAAHLPDGAAIQGRLPRSGQRALAAMRLSASTLLDCEEVRRECYVGQRFQLVLPKGVAVTVDRQVVCRTERDTAVKDAAVWKAAMTELKDRRVLSYAAALVPHVAYWTRTWKDLDVTIDGDPANQQGVRFCIFQLHQTYHGVDPSLNVAAKGLTGQAYGGHTWWDTETYCLPFYLFNNPQAARNLLGYRYRTLANAIRRSASDDAVGARYPMSSIDGYEACGWWAHGDLEIHVSVAVAYGIWHYVHVTGERQYLIDEGLEMLLQISRFYASRGGWGQRTGEFGLYGVMGPDEFHMMVDNNCYTNVMVKKAFGWTLDAMKDVKRLDAKRYAAILKRVGLKPSEPKEWARMAAKMRVPQDRTSGVFEQHDGYFNYPHTDCAKIPPTEFPLYKYWSYFRIFRTDMIKQPDVLLLHFFFGGEYSLANKKANYDFYEPRCSHESSLSPGVHSILAAELGYHSKAFAYWGHAARLDLDDWNRNSNEGLHTTSMAAAWLNVVYGFGGMRSDGDRLSFAPSVPKAWKSFSFRVTYRGSVLQVAVGRKDATFTVVSGASVPITAFGKAVTATAAGVSVALPKGRVG